MGMSLQEIASVLGYGSVERLQAAIVRIAELTPQEVAMLERGELLPQVRCDKVLCVFFMFQDAARAALDWRVAEVAARHEAAELTHRAEARGQAEEYRRLWLDWLADRRAPGEPGSVVNVAPRVRPPGMEM